MKEGGGLENAKGFHGERQEDEIGQSEEGKKG